MVVIVVAASSSVSRHRVRKIKDPFLARLIRRAKIRSRLIIIASSVDRSKGRPPATVETTKPSHGQTEVDSVDSLRLSVCPHVCDKQTSAQRPNVEGPRPSVTRNAKGEQWRWPMLTLFEERLFVPTRYKYSLFQVPPNPPCGWTLDLGSTRY